MVNEQYERKELIKYNGKHYLVSRVMLSGTKDWETMIFPANEQGDVINWMEEYVDHGYTPIIDTVISFIGPDSHISDVEGDLD